MILSTCRRLRRAIGTPYGDDSLVRRLALSALAVALFASAASANDPPPYWIDTSRLEKSEPLVFATERAIVFKDGYALLVKHAKGRTDAHGRLISEQVPDEAILGSVWVDVIAAEGAEPIGLKSLTARRETLDETKPETHVCRSMSELLRANLEREVTLSTDRGDLVGTLVELIGSESNEPFVDPLSSAPPVLSLTRRSIDATHVVVSSQGRQTVLAIGEIRRLHAPELEVRLTTEATTRRDAKQWVLQFDRADAEVDVRLIYFRSGIRWIPTYRVTLGDDPTTAEVALQAELLNEAETLENAAIDLVVGVPNFRFRETPSPLVLEAAMRMTLQQAAPLLMNNAMSNSSQALFTQRSGEFRREEALAPGEGVPAIPSELAGSGAQDLYVIPIEPMSLGQGERAAVPLGRSIVPCRHVYTWDLQVVRSAVDSTPTAGADDSPLQLSVNRVWHQLELTNVTDAPWTTGAALLLDGHQPLAQELLGYTSPGATVRIPVTVAVDLRGDYDEVEADRKLDAVIWHGDRHARIDKLGTISLRNAKRTPVSVEIAVSLPGSVDSAGADGKVSIGDFRGEAWTGYVGSPGLNRHSTVRWAFELAPDETFTTELRSHFFVRQ